MELLDEIGRGASSGYRAFLARAEASRQVGDLVLLYGRQDLVERNATYEVQTYLPGWVAIGDDGGGSAILVRLDGSDAVYQCGHGALGSVDPELVAESFAAWHASGCPLPED